ncbi:hypothetical protein BSKO_03001 [Bryopsis sp. KO-2023]|nr:hypothetical protein BSKO_03001 [Bryopsis sp. KO-2023]
MSKSVHKSDPEKASSQKFFKSNATHADGDRGVSGLRGSYRAVPLRQGRDSGGRHFRSNSGNRGGGASRGQGRGGRSGDQEGRVGSHHTAPGEWGSTAEHTRPQGSAVAVGTGEGGASRNRFVSANHLLNFSKYDNSRSRGGGGGGRAYRGYARRERYNRDEFLQANFRFLVSDAVDVRSFASEADKMFQWDDIVQVEMTVSAPVKCPITLDCPPVAPQITPCGHVFGFSGIMQHMMVSGGRSLRCAAKCPLCFTPIVARELRSVIFHRVEPPFAGSLIRFRLLKRGRASIIPEVIGVPEGTPFNTLQCNRFAKFTTCTDGLDVWSKDADQLAKSAAQVISEGGLEATLEAPALYTALDSLAGRAKAWATRRAAKLNPHMDPEEVGAKMEASVRQIFTGRISSVASAQHREKVVKQFDQNFPSLGNKAASGSSRGQDGDLPFLQENQNDAAGGMEVPSSGITMQFGSVAPLGSSPTSHSPPFSKDSSDVAFGASPPTAQPASEYFFYQSMDGQWFFLHPANVKCLMMMHGSYERCPQVIEGRIVEMDDMVQGEFLRKRYRNLAHLPNKGSFKLVEVDLGALVPPEFMEPIRQRQEQRRKRAKKEKRNRQRERREAAAAQDAVRAPTIEEFRSMPDLSAFSRKSSGDDGGDPSDLGFFPQESEQDGGQNAGVSWSAVTKLGFAASWQAPEDSVSTQFPSLPGGGSAQENPTPSQQHPVRKAKNPTNAVWKVENGIASASLKAKQTAPPLQEALQKNHPKPVASKKGKKGKTLLFSNSQRRG